MNLYEHTIVARQDTSPAQIKQLTEKYSKIVENNDGEIIQTEDKKGIYMHFKIKGSGKIIEELEKNEIIDKNLLRNMTVKVKKFDLEAKYFSKKDDYEKKDYKKDYNRN